jgi:MFS family permease
MLSQPAPETALPGATPPAAAHVLEPGVPGTSLHLSGGAPLRRYLLWLGLATAAITTIWGGVTSIILPNHVQLLEFGRFFTGADAGVDLQQLNALKTAIEAGTTTATADQTRQLDLLRQFEASRVQSLALVATVGAILTMLIQPVVGVLSDRTRSRFGRRVPWILFGGVIGSFLLISVRFAPTIGVLVILWTLAQMVLNAASGPLSATLADRVVESKRGTGSGIAGLGSMVGGLGGALIAGAAFGAMGLDSYFVMAGLVIIGVVGFAFFAKDRSSTTLEYPRQTWGSFFKGFLVPLRSADFRWVWIARVLLTFGFGISTAMSFFMLQSYVQPALSAAEATALSPLLGVAGFPGMLIGLIVAGRLSDKLGRRKPFVIFASLLMAVGFIVSLLIPTVPGLLIGGVIGGLAFGSYLSVDQALFIDVLPDKDAAGRDLGIAALGNNLGQALAPVIAAQVVVVTGGYTGIWVVAAALVVVAALAIIPVKGTR